MFLIVPSPLLFLAIILTAFLYLKVSVEPILEDVEGTMLVSYLNTGRWLVREYGLIGFLVVKVFQAMPHVRFAVQRV